MGVYNTFQLLLLWKRVGVGVVSLAWSHVFFQELVLG